MISIGIVDDEKSITQQIKQYIQQYAQENHTEFLISEFYDGLELLKTTDYPDILFLDIDMPNLNGIAAAREIRKRDKKCIIIFVTNIAQYAIKGYEVNALDFIVKPVKYNSFAFKLQRAVEQAEKEQDDVITVTVKYGKKRLYISDIYYVEVIKHKLIYHTIEETIEVWGSMVNARAVLEPHHFFLCNVCYLVNLKHVRSVIEDDVVVGKDTLKISRLKKKDFLDALTEYIN